MYKMTVRSRQLVELRRSLFKDFGRPEEPPSAKRKAFDEKLEAEGKAKAEAADKAINAQLQELLAERHRLHGTVEPAPK